MTSLVQVERQQHTAINDLIALGIVERNDMQGAFWRVMRRFKAIHKRVSLADRAALALARELGAILLTADRHELQPLSTLSICEFKFIR